MWLWLQRVIAAAALVAVAPALLALAAAIRWTSPGPVLHRTRRISRGRPFTMLKLRTMKADAGGSAITAAGDTRVTRVGRVLRRTKLDELPQLWNVVRGEMALVGPRPEDPRYVRMEDPLHRYVFSALPGITGPAAIAFRDEERLLAEAALALAREGGGSAPTDTDVDRAYRERILPRKLALDADYLRTRSWRRDVGLLAATLIGVARRSPT